MNNITFAGRILFANKESYNNFIGNRKQINQLKHHSGNKNLTHFIQYDKDFFVITTTFEHARKLDDTTSHVLSEVRRPPNKGRLSRIVNNYINKVRIWQSEINRMPNHPNTEYKAPKKRNFLEKIIEFFKKR